MLWRSLAVTIVALPSLAFAQTSSSAKETIKAVQHYGAGYGEFLAQATRCEDALETTEFGREEICRSFRLIYIARFDEMKKVSTMCIEQLKNFSALRNEDAALAKDVSAYCGTISALDATPRFREVTEVLGRSR